MCWYTYRNSLPSKKIAKLIAEIVAIVREQIIGFCSKLGHEVPNKLFSNFWRYLSNPVHKSRIAYTIRRCPQHTCGWSSYSSLLWYRIPMTIRVQMNLLQSNVWRSAARWRHSENQNWYMHRNALKDNRLFFCCAVYVKSLGMLWNVLPTPINILYSATNQFLQVTSYTHPISMTCKGRPKWVRPAGACCTPPPK